VVDHVLHFEGGTAVPYTGGYESFVQQRQERRLSQQRAFDKQQKVVAGEADYIARNIAGQNSRQAKGRRKRLERLPRLSAPVGDEGTMALRLEIAERGGDQVAVAENVTIAVGDRTLIERFDGRVMRGDRLGIFGPNGAGKSTPAARTGRGALHPTRGSSGSAARSGRLLRSASSARYRSTRRLRRDRRAASAVGATASCRDTSAASASRETRYSDARRRSRGGERARVATGDVDADRRESFSCSTSRRITSTWRTIEVLGGRYRGDTRGTVILVSHDRAMLRALASKVWVLHERQSPSSMAASRSGRSVSEERAHAASVRAGGGGSAAARGREEAHGAARGTTRLVRRSAAAASGGGACGRAPNERSPSWSRR
jgi:ATP-binding cassette subfamily F protein 3